MSTPPCPNNFGGVPHLAPMRGRKTDRACTAPARHLYVGTTDIEEMVLTILPDHGQTGQLSGQFTWTIFKILNIYSILTD
jgi:hypothetical protein